jgi:MFS family permease
LAGIYEMSDSMFSAAYKRYALVTLTLVYGVSMLDQGLITLLLQPIKEDLHLSDTELGFLTGIAFALLYAMLTLPIGRWADRGNRTTIAATAVGLWGAALMLCLFATNFFQLVLARAAAAVGASGSMAPTYSLVGEYFPKSSEHTHAMTIYMLAGPLSVLVSFIVGGWLNERVGWRATFLIMGIPGLLIAALVKMTIAEPRRECGRPRCAVQQAPSMREVLRTVWRLRSSRHLSIAIILFFVMGFGLSPWYAAFMMRTHGMNTAELGVWFGLIAGLGGIAGIWLGGFAAVRLFPRNEQGQMRLIAVMSALMAPCFGLFLLLPNRQYALAAFIPLVMASNFYYGPTFALMQRLVANEMRATTLAVVMLLSTLIGMGIGPQAVGLLSDILRPALGDDSLRYAMLILSLVTLWSAFHFWQVGRTVKDDLLAVALRAQPETLPLGFQDVGLKPATSRG